MGKDRLQEHLNNPLYQDARKLWNGVQANQIAKGAEKYPEPLNPDSWTSTELIFHAMQENVDQAHYLTALLNKIEKNKVPVKIKKLHPDAVVPKYAREMDAGFDLVAVEDVVVRPGESVKVKTGLAMALPPGFELQVRPRSGVSSKTKLRISNAPGTVDAGFRGEICVLIDNLAQMIPTSAIDGEILFDTTFMLIGIDGKSTDYVPKGIKEKSFYDFTYVIKAGDRIAQGVLASVPIAEFEVVDELDDTERGSGGFGSSGVTAI